jgi:hypothetical protein
MNSLAASLFYTPVARSVPAQTLPSQLHTYISLSFLVQPELIYTPIQNMANISLEKNFFFEKLIFVPLVNKFLAFHETRISLLCAQQSPTGR